MKTSNENMDFATAINVLKCSEPKNEMDLVLKNYFLKKLSTEVESTKGEGKGKGGIFTNALNLNNGNERKLKRVEICEKDFEENMNMDEGEEI